jgi:very-short-patch-repair endonuclease
MRTRPDLTRITPEVAELFRRQAGLARRDQLRQRGVTNDHVDVHVLAGRWAVVAPMVISADNGRLDHEQLLWRAALHGPCGWIGGRSALAVDGLEGYPPARIHLLAPQQRRPDPLDGVIVHVSRRLPGDLPDLARGLPRTNPARSTVDAAAWDPHPRLAAGLVLAVLQQQIAIPEDILAELDVAGRVRHRAVVRRTIEDAVGGAESLTELDIEPLIRRAGLTVARRQVRSGRRREDIEVDLPDGTVLVIEVDGPQHDTPQARWADAARDADVLADGRLPLRIPAYAIRYEPDVVVARLRAIYEAARRRARAGFGWI